MTPFDSPDFDGRSQVAFFSDESAGLRCIIAVQDTTRGPALGGTRMWPYASNDEALIDALRLSRGMTYKSALAELPLGGGKAVIIADPKTDKTDALWAAYGRAVEALSGRYVTAEDVGVGVPDLEMVRRETRHVAGIPEGGSGDPSPATAFGVFTGLSEAVRYRLGRTDLADIRVAVQGLGAVGMALCRHLRDAGAKLIVADIDAARVDHAVQDLGATAADPAVIHTAACDVFAPCALGGGLDAETIPEITASVVAGSANNQLATPQDGELLRAHGILYAPDYAINAGGIINISHEGPGYDKARSWAHIARIADTVRAIFDMAEQQGIATSEALDRLARQRLVAPG